MAYLFLKFLLGGFEFVDGGLGVLEGLDEHAVLYAFLEYALYAAVSSSYFEGDGSHLFDIQFAKGEE